MEASQLIESSIKCLGDPTSSGVALTLPSHVTSSTPHWASNSWASASPASDGPICLIAGPLRIYFEPPDVQTSGRRNSRPTSRSDPESKNFEVTLR